MDFDPVTFVNTLAGGLLGGGISWVITHLYAKASEKSAATAKQEILITLEDGNAKVLAANGRRVAIETLGPAAIRALGTVASAVLSSQRQPPPPPPKPADPKA